MIGKLVLFRIGDHGCVRELTGGGSNAGTAFTARFGCLTSDVNSATLMGQRVSCSS